MQKYHSVVKYMRLNIQNTSYLFEYQYGFLSNHKRRFFALFREHQFKVRNR